MLFKNIKLIKMSKYQQKIIKLTKMKIENRKIKNYNSISMRCFDKICFSALNSGLL